MGQNQTKTIQKLSDNDVRSFLKKCFKNELFSVAPFEIWRDLILSNADSKTITNLSQTCWAFKHLVSYFNDLLLDLALLLEKKEKFILLCIIFNDAQKTTTQGVCFIWLMGINSMVGD